MEVLRKSTNMKYIPIQCHSVIRRVRNGFPYQYDMNIYRGCEHGCLYCYALYSHDYLDDNRFYEHIYYKENVIDVLEKELSSGKINGIINIGSVCDSYQPCEKELGLMREILKVMIKHKQSIHISTKSKLILRDIDLLNELSKITYVNITSSITLVDQRKQKLIEPNASTSLERMKTLKIIKEKTNASVGVLLMPIIPYIGDSYENLEAIYKIAKSIPLDYIYPGTLYLRGKTKKYFLKSIKDIDDNVYHKIQNLYNDGKCSLSYKKDIYKKINELNKKYNMKYKKKTL